MAKNYVELNTNLNTNQSTLIDQLNGRQGDANREVFFQIKDGTTPYNLEGKTIALFAKDAQGVIKATSTINDQTGISVGRFSMIIPKEFYQASGVVEDAYIQISSSDKVISTIPVSFQVIANTMLVTQTQSQMFIDSVQSLIDDTNQRLSTTTTSLTSVENAVEALKVTIGNLNDQYNSDLFAKKANDNEFKGVNTFEQKIIAPNGLQGKSDSAGQADEATHATKADNADSAKHAEVADKLVPENDQTVNNLTVKGQLKVSGNQKVVSFSGTIPKFGFAIEGKRIGDTVRINLGRHDTPDIRSWTGFDYALPNGFKPAFDVSNVMWCDLQIAKLQINQDGSFFLMNRGIQHTTPGDSGFTLEFKTNDDFPE